MSFRKKIRTNIIFSFLGQIAILFVAFLLPRSILLHFGSEINGLINSVNQIISYLIIFEAGIQAVSLKSLYKQVYEQNFSEINQILSAVHIQYKKTAAYYLIGLSSFSVLYAIFIKIASLTPIQIFFIVFFSGFSNVLIFYIQAQYIVLLKADGRNYIIEMVNTLVSVMNNLGKLLFINLGYSITFVIIISFFISLLQVTFIYFYANKKYPFIDLHAKPNFHALDQKNSALVHEIAFLIFQNIDVLLLTVFSNLKVVSVYSLYKMIVFHLRIIIRKFYDSTNFALGQLFNANKEVFVHVYDGISISYNALIFAVFSTTYTLITPFLALYTREIEDIVYIDPYLPLLFVISEILVLIRDPFINVIGFAGHFQKSVNRTIIETLINIVLSLALIFPLGIHGVLLATIVALTYRFIDLIFYVNRKILKRGVSKSFLIFGSDLLILLISQFFLRRSTFSIHSYQSFIWYGFIILGVNLLLFILPKFLLFFNDLKSILKYALHRY